ncbi:hypothetical protein EVAR_46921_1 [Eumeta japonica]|uniref:Uncharacterized protein n=1 Tax=Eumeta variegata TaxID=151549 RepID=A0A4C1XX89_EUMVA|nr:hypothetical protein EVAR_46921_1 [Eumeta japonica]
MPYGERRQASSSRCSLTIPPCTYAAKPNLASALSSRRPSMSLLDDPKPGGSKVQSTRSKALNLEQHGGEGGPFSYFKVKPDADA